MIGAMMNTGRFKIMSLYTERPDDWVTRSTYDEDKYLVVRPLSWRIGKSHPLSIVVPPGFEFDVSIPWWAAWWAKPDDPRYIAPAAIHDFMLHEMDADRGVAGGVFCDALKADGVSLLRRIVMTVAVIVGPARSW